jgi:hypothetical protein
MHPQQSHLNSSIMMKEDKVGLVQTTPLKSHMMQPTTPQLTKRRERGKFHQAMQIIFVAEPDRMDV